MTGQLLSVQDLDVVYHGPEGRIPALRGISLSIAESEIVGLVGESGSGKSTLATSLLRLLPATGEITSGVLSFRGRDLLALDKEEMRRMRGGEIAMVFQDPLSSLTPTSSIGQQMLRAAAAHPEKVVGDRRAQRRRVIDLLTQVGIPDASDRIDNYPHQFSGGMRQRIMIAMALMLQPALLIADEPTSALDVTLEAQILELFRRLQEDYGTAILFVSHDLAVVSQFCDRAIVMYAGRVMEEARVASLFEHPTHPYTKALLDALPSHHKRGAALTEIPGSSPALHSAPAGCAFADRCRFVHPICTRREPALYGHPAHRARCFLLDPTSGVEARLVSGTSRHEAVPRKRADAPLGDLLLTLRAVSTHYGANMRVFGKTRRPVRAVDDVTLDLRRGEVIGLVGESGSGKTTLGLTVLRLAPWTAGDIMFDGVNLGDIRHGALRRLRRRMQMIFQDPYSSLSPRMRVDSLLTEPYRIHRTPEAAQYSVRELLELVRLSDGHRRKFPHELSGGQARRIGIARALAVRPDLIIADEPTSGLDASAAASILNLLADLRRDLGLTYLLITHNLNLVGHSVDRLAVMYLGQLVEVGPVGAVLDTPTHPYTQGLLAALPEVKASAHPPSGKLLLSGEIPSPRSPPPGCRFHTRCRLAQAICRTERPGLVNADSDHAVACHFWPQARESRMDALVDAKEKEHVMRTARE